MYGVVVLPLIYLFINILRLLILKSFRTAVLLHKESLQRDMNIYIAD